MANAGTHRLSTKDNNTIHRENNTQNEIKYTVFQKSDAKIQITITTAYLTRRIKYPLSGFNYHLSDVNISNFNKIHCTVSEQQLFKKWNSKTVVSNMENTDSERSRVCPTWKGVRSKRPRTKTAAY